MDDDTIVRLANDFVYEIQKQKKSRDLWNEFVTEVEKLVNVINEQVQEEGHDAWLAPTISIPSDFAVSLAYVGSNIDILADLRTGSISFYVSPAGAYRSESVRISPDGVLVLNAQGYYPEYSGDFATGKLKFITRSTWSAPSQLAQFFIRLLILPGDRDDRFFTKIES